MRASRLAPLLQKLPQILTLIAIAVGLLIVRNWAYVTTYRLFLTSRAGAAPRSAAAQRFDVEGARVVPQIVTREDDLIAFKTALGRPSTLEVGVRPSGRVGYEIRWKDGSASRMLARGDTSEPVVVAVPIPARDGVVELASHGSLTWIDPRLIRDLRVAPHLTAMALLLAAALLLSRCTSAPVAPPGAATDLSRRSHGTAKADRVVWFRRVALAGSIAVSLLALETGLRALGDRVPGGIASERHDLGEVRQDPRWEDTAPFGRRLRRNVDAVNEWRYGDIVRMGYVPAAVGDGALHRFTFKTDDEGFRNPRVRERIDVAALGDSFTDAMTLRIDDAWPTRLERQTGLAVQNYGTAGWGPQQELLALREYAVRHHPRIVVLAYFAGNDLFDAEAFEDFTRSAGAMRRPAPGWQIKDVVSRADTWFLVSAMRATATWLSTFERAEARAGAATPETVRATADPVAAGDGVSFDRGMFTASVNGRAMRWAFMPPYLNTLTMTEQELGARRGWTLTMQAIAEMQRVSRDAGAAFAVMFLPFKSQVYLPWLVQSPASPLLASDLKFYLPDNPGTPDVAAMLRNRLAQNRLMRRFCDERGIPLLDTTEALTARFLGGENVYFPDESHFNETGHAVVAGVLGSYLTSRR